MTGKTKERVAVTVDLITVVAEVGALCASLATWSFSDTLGNYRLVIVVCQILEILLLLYTRTSLFRHTNAFWAFGLWTFFVFAVMVPSYVARAYYAAAEQSNPLAFYLQIVCATLWVPRVVSIMLVKFCAPAPHEEIFTEDEGVIIVTDTLDADSSPAAERPGMSLHDIAQIPRGLCTAQDSPHAYDDDCSVCNESFLEGQEMINLSCRHAFHADCLSQWLVRNPSCPLCRSTVRPASPTTDSADAFDTCPGAILV